MKFKVYTRFLNFTSQLLNFCVKYNFWWGAKQILEFRKHHIAKTLRKELAF